MGTLSDAVEVLTAPAAGLGARDRRHADRDVGGGAGLQRAWGCGAWPAFSILQPSVWPGRAHGRRLAPDHGRDGELTQARRMATIGGGHRAVTLFGAMLTSAAAVGRVSCGPVRLEPAARRGGASSARHRCSDGHGSRGDGARDALGHGHRDDRGGAPRGCDAALTLRIRVRRPRAPAGRRSHAFLAFHPLVVGVEEIELPSVEGAHGRGDERLRARSWHPTGRTPGPPHRLGGRAHSILTGVAAVCARSTRRETWASAIRRPRTSRPKPRGEPRPSVVDGYTSL